MITEENLHKKTLLAEFDKFAMTVFPKIIRGSHEYNSARRTFFGGAIFMTETLANPDDDEDETMAWVEALRSICDDEVNP